MGHTKHARPRILAFHALQFQVGYLGFAATTGADFIDYVIADRIVLPSTSSVLERANCSSPGLLFGQRLDTTRC